MQLFGVVVNLTGMEPVIKLVEQDVYDWITLPDNPKATIDPVPLTVFEKMEGNPKYTKFFRGSTNDLIKPSDYENFKAEIAPAFKDGFETLSQAKEFCKENDYEYAGDIIKFLKS